MVGPTKAAWRPASHICEYRIDRTRIRARHPRTGCRARVRRPWPPFVDFSAMAPNLLPTETAGIGTTGWGSPASQAAAEQVPREPIPAPVISLRADSHRVAHPPHIAANRCRRAEALTKRPRTAHPKQRAHTPDRRNQYDPKGGTVCHVLRLPSNTGEPSVLSSVGRYASSHSPLSYCRYGVMERRTKQDREPLRR
jgi:hypothetical protein